MPTPKKDKKTIGGVVKKKINAHTNNPNGRPKGAGNKCALSVKERIVGMVNDNFEDYVTSLEKLKNSTDLNDTKVYLKSFTELIKLVVPRALNEEEKDYLKNSPSEMFAKYFNIKKNE